MPTDGWQRLAIVTMFGLTLLMACVIGSGFAIRHGDVTPPHLEVSLSGFHIVTYVSTPTECQLSLPCQHSTPDSYVIWVFRTTASARVPGPKSWKLIIPLRC